MAQRPQPKAVLTLPVQSDFYGRPGRPRLRETEVQSLLKFLEGDLWRYSAVNNTISRVSETEWFQNILSDPDFHLCPTCFKRCRYADQAERHCNAARTRYRCIQDNCCKRFTSFPDLVSHHARHKEKACFRCDGLHTGLDGSPCHSLYGPSRKDYRAHLRYCRVGGDLHDIARATFVPASDNWIFWCGFCNSVINLRVPKRAEPLDMASRSGKFEHIRAHLSNGMLLGNWITLGGGGYKKSYVERARNQTKIVAVEYPLLPETSRNDISDDDDDCEFNNLDEHHPPENHEGDDSDDDEDGDLTPAGLGESMNGASGIPPSPILTTSLPTVKTEDTEMSDINAIASPRSEASGFLTSTKYEPELKFFSVEINSIDERRWVEPRYSIEPRHDYEPRTTDEALQFGPMRRSDEPMALVRDRRSDELREAVPTGVQSSRMLSPAAMHLYYCNFRECLKEDGSPRSFFLCEGDVQWHKHTHHGA